MIRFHSLNRPLATLAIAAALVASASHAQDTVTPVSLEQDSSDAMVDSPLFKLSWPKFSWKPSFGGKEDASAPTAPRENPVSGALDKLAASSKRAADGVRGAWGSAMSKLPFAGGSSQPGVQTARQEKPSIWARLFTEPEPQGSETVSEFIAQDRVGTTRR